MGAGVSMIGDQAVGVDEISAHGGGCVSLIDDVVHLLDEDRQGNVKVQATALGDLLPLFVALVLPEEDAIRHVALGLPSIRGVGFPYIHYEKLGPVAKTVADLFDAPNLDAVGGSSVTAENQSYRAFSPEAGQPNPLLGPHKLEVEVRWLLTHLGTPFTSRYRGVQP